MRSDRLGHSSPSSTSSAVKDGLSGSNDDSSVVSLEALVAKADAKAASSRPTTEDSGLIDLKSLMASASPPSSDSLPPVLEPSAAGLFDVPEPTLNPYVSEAPSLASETPAPAPSRAAKWFVVASAVVFAIVGTIGVLHARTNRATAEQANSPAVTPAAQIEAQQAEPAAIPVAPKAPEIANVAPEVAPQAVPAQTPKSGQSTAISKPRDSNQPKATPEKAKSAEVAPPAGACDLMCEIQRAAKKKKAQ